jgi:hypothetical protein
MMHDYIIGVGALLLLSTAWIGVQRAWKRSFPDAVADPDALAGRSGCNGCNDSKDCHRRPESGACKTQEETP